MSYNKYPFKITKILDNDLFEKKKYDGSDLIMTIKLYNVIFPTYKIEKINKKISPLMKTKVLEFEIKEINDYGEYEGNIYY